MFFTAKKIGAINDKDIIKYIIIGDIANILISSKTINCIRHTQEKKKIESINIFLS